MASAAPARPLRPTRARDRRRKVVNGVMLGLTMAATMVIGNTPKIQSSLFQPATTAASLVASQLPNACRNPTLYCVE